MKLSFKANQQITLGVEIELQLIDPKTGDLVSGAPKILQKLSRDKHIKAEIFQSMLEIETPICTSASGAAASLTSSMQKVQKAADAEGIQVLMAGTHPFAHYTERQLTEDSRYHQLVDRNKWITRRLQIFGMHCHLGMRDGDHAIAVNNALCHYLPIVLALSASSPFWHSEDTGLASSRITFFEAIPTGGHPYAIRSWKDFQELVGKMIASKSITSLKDLWWDIRPNTDYGTIEVRIADCPPTLQEVEALVALIHTLALHIDHEIKNGQIFTPQPEWIMRENKWRASRHGIAAELIMNLDGGSESMQDIWTKLTGKLSPFIRQCQYEKNFDFLNEIYQKGPSYVRQRQAFENGGLAAVVEQLVKETKTNKPSWQK